MIKYPASIDNSISLPPVQDSTRLAPNLFNNLRDGILSVENELGVKPSGTYGTVRARLDALEGKLNKGILIGGDIGGTTVNPVVIGIQGNPVSSTSPQINNILIWNGTAWVPTPDNIIPVTITNNAYTVSNTDYFVGATAGTTITLPVNPVKGETHIIKDISGSAGSSGGNITIDGNGKNIDGATGKHLTIDYQGLTVVYNGTNWSRI